MTHKPHFTHLLTLPKVEVQNANAIAGPMSYGFPSITAFLGLQWALERKCRERGMDVRFAAVGVVCHEHQTQVASGRSFNGFHLTRNPVGANGKAGAIAEEGRMHMTVSLLLATSGQAWETNDDATKQTAQTVLELLRGMRIAGGSVLTPERPSPRAHAPRVTPWRGEPDESAQRQFRTELTRLLPGFALVARDQLLADRLAELRQAAPRANPLDALLSFSELLYHHDALPPDGKPKKIVDWKMLPRPRGWLVPMPVGYQALGELLPAGTVANTRDRETQVRFVESLYSLGEWISPHRLGAPNDLLWYASLEGDTDSPDASSPPIYRCRNDYMPADALGYSFD